MSEQRKQAAAKRWATASDLVKSYGTTWATAFRLASGGTVGGDDLSSYCRYQANLHESPYLLGRRCPAFRD